MLALRRYKRLPFAINTASAIFQESIKELLTGLPGCENISDNIIVFGRGKDEHDRNFRGVLQRLQDNNLRLNKDKENGVDIPPTVDKAQEELPNSDEPRKNTPLRRSQRQIRPSVRF